VAAPLVSAAGDRAGSLVTLPTPGAGVWLSRLSPVVPEVAGVRSGAGIRVSRSGSAKSARLLGCFRI